jgi:hypothetical protein
MKPEKMYKTGSLFRIVGDGDRYMFCQVGYSQFVLINLLCGNRYTEIKRFNSSAIEYPFSFIKSLADEQEIEPIKED